MKIENIFGTSGVSIDTRTLSAGNIFVAIQGENFDGHDFIDVAIKNGAAMIIASQSSKKTDKMGCPILIVQDTIQALGELARFHRMNFDLPIIAITGSNGKTTVKTMVGSIFSQNGVPLVTQGNFNNEIGLPLTLLQLKKEHEVAILEMGSRHIGDIQYLCKLAKPTISLVNNVMPAHLECFGSLEGVAKAKGEIYEALSPQGFAILNTDTLCLEYFKTIISQSQKNVISFGLDARNNPDITAKNIEFSNQSIRFILVTPLGEIAIVCPTVGQHNVLNALAASSIALAAGLGLEDIAKGLAQFSSVNGRLQQSKTPVGVALIDDTYNANPGSFEAAIEVLARASGSKILVMGDMGELGENASLLHEHIGQYARDKGIDRLFAVGQLCEYAVKGFGVGAQLYENKSMLIKALENFLDQNMTCLIKGSRSAKMEMVVQALLNNHNQIIGEY